mgnify:CR=1 FL=1
MASLTPVVPDFEIKKLLSLKNKRFWEENLMRKIITLEGFGLMEEMEKKSLYP